MIKIQSQTQPVYVFPKAKKSTDQKSPSPHFGRSVHQTQKPLNVLLRSSNCSEQTKESSLESYQSLNREKRSSDPKINIGEKSTGSSSSKRRVLNDSQSKQDVQIQGQQAYYVKKSKEIVDRKNSERSFKQSMESQQKSSFNWSQTRLNSRNNIDSDIKSEQESQILRRFPSLEGQHSQLTQATLKSKYKNFLQNSELFKISQVNNLKLSDQSKKVFEMNQLNTEEKIDQDSQLESIRISAENLSPQKLHLTPPKEYLTNGLAMLSLSIPQQRLKTSMMELSKGVIESKKEFEHDINEASKQEKQQVREKMTMNSLINTLKEVIPLNLVKDNTKESSSTKQQSSTQRNRKQKALESSGIKQSNASLPDSFEETSMKFQKLFNRENSEHHSEINKDFNKNNAVDFCLLQIMEQLESKVICQFERNKVKFDKMCFETILEIINENIPSIILRINKEEDSNLHSFLQYISNFLSWLFTSIIEHFDREVKEKANEEFEKQFGNITALKEQIEKKEKEIKANLESMSQYEKQVATQKTAYYRDKIKLVSQINVLQEKIQAMNKPDFYSDSSHQLTLKILDLQHLMSNLQSESQSAGQALKDNLCSLGVSVMAKTRDMTEFQQSIQKGIGFSRGTDDHFYNILKEHPFFTAFVYNKIIPSNQEILSFEETPMSQDTQVSLKQFLFYLSEDDLYENNCAEAFMEFILGNHSSQHEGFLTIQRIIMEITKDSKQPLSQFFSNLFGIGGFPFPSFSAVKDTLSLLEGFRKQYKNYVEQDQSIACDKEAEQLISQIIQNQNVLMNFREKFIIDSRQVSIFAIISFILQSISAEEEREKSEDLYNSVAVSSKESIQSFQETLSYKKAKQLATQLKIKPFTFFNYLIQTFEKYSRKIKKPNEERNSISIASQGIDSRSIPKNCFLAVRRHMLFQSGSNIPPKLFNTFSNSKILVDSAQKESDFIHQSNSNQSAPSIRARVTSRKPTKKLA